ncbi:hypothetical protein ACTNBL_00300 [Enterococcus villorum]|uniref:Uncharacterized protein n=2 Tax=Enterococcus villorum TaxID=112904 RepID=A0A511J1G6_9ENTE|nr:hypothetical protein [Enterococcus villorum]EOH91560.1 hypothetical protein UAO_00893 [Enterococcus villorum ATCC 700913]EOW76938.1 hypothetical protein I591_02246 [Enterococcus villorum ATCC 700913]GEL91861.1 hypothetical protein EVI01_11980 [Enterococcus villorum]
MKKTIIIISIFLGLIVLFFVVDFLTSPIRDVTSKAEMKIDNETKMEYVPTEDELLKLEGDQLQFLGFYEVVSISFDDQPHITLLNDNNEEINFSISILDKQKKTFSIPAIQFSPQNLQLTDSFGLAKKSAKYFAYKRNHPLAGATHTTN